MSFDNDTVSTSGIGPMLVSSRSLAEYSAMFALTTHDLTGSVLDCPAGAASFTAEVNASGDNATACDPIYAEHSADELAVRSRKETDRGNCYVRTYPEQYRWSFFAGPDEHQRSRRAAGVRFAGDMARRPQCYVTGQLPKLPFATASFDLVLSSHLLFSYADRLDFAFHYAAVRELMRLTRAELRIFPLVAMGSVSYPRLDELRTQLAEAGVHSRVTAVDYEFQKGGSHMLVCNHAGAGDPQC